MIVRTWHGCVPLKHAEGFANHLQRTGGALKEYRGEQRCICAQGNQGDREHFFLATYWQDLPSVKAFAGENYQVAVTYPDDEEFELLSDPYVFQHVVEAISPL
jgi:heme-degrading monooxygenase HmoA